MVMSFLFIRPRDCHDCGNGYYGMGHAIDAIESSLDTNIVDLNATEATMQPVIDAINENNPDIVFSFGHGLSHVATGNNEQPIFTEDNIDILSGRRWHALSCLVGRWLGMEMVIKNGLSFNGYDESWYWVADDTSVDPYTDRYAEGYYKSHNAGIINLAETDDPLASYQASVDEYNNWIDQWLENPDEDKYATEVAKWLIWDRNNHVTYTKPVALSSSRLAPIAVMGIPMVVGAWIAAGKTVNVEETWTT